MSHLNGHDSLKTWKKGDQLLSADLNANFRALAGMAETAMAAALQPDPAAVGLEMSLRDIKQRLATVEYMLTLHARQRNEREWAPLSHVGAVVTLVNDLRRDLEKAMRRLEEMHASLGGEHLDLERRLARLEQQPEAATEEAFSALARDHKRVAQKEHMLLAQIIALRHETRILRELTMGHDRQANRMEYAPLSTVAHLLQRIMALEAGR